MKSKNYYNYQKLNYVKYFFSRKQLILSYMPITISLVSTSKCPLKCLMCATHSPLIPKDYKWIQDTENDMSFEVFKKAANMFKEAINLQIIGAGEPLLNKDFYEIVEYGAKKMKFKVKTFSDGITLAANIDKLLKSSLDGITISINSPNVEDYLRLAGNTKEIYNTIVKDTKKLIEERNRRNSKLKVKVSFIVDKINYKLIPDMIKMGTEYFNADTIFLVNFLPVPYKGFTFEERTLSTKDSEILNFINKIKANLTNEERKIVSFPKIVNLKSPKRCKSHFEQIRIDGDGNISSCSISLLKMNWGYKIFDYDNGMDAWNNEFFISMRKRFLSESIDDLYKPCKTCPENFY